MNTNIRTIGGSVGTAFILSLITAGHGPAGAPLESGYVTAFWALAAIGLISALVAAAIPSRTPARGTASDSPSQPARQTADVC